MSTAPNGLGLKPMIMILAVQLDASDSVMAGQHWCLAPKAHRLEKMLYYALERLGARLGGTYPLEDAEENAVGVKDMRGRNNRLP